MKRKCIIFLFILLLVICCKQSFNYIYNEHVIGKYNNGDYSTDTSTLKVLNCFQPYIAHYNNGNIYYQEENYDKAIEEYNEALGLHPPKDRECSIRINLALAMIKNLGEDYDVPENVDASIEQLKKAKEVLLEEDCATQDGEGHSRTAEKLKEEIEELIRQLEEQANADPEPEDDGEEKDDTQSVEDELEENLKQELQQIQSEAYQEREENLQFMDEIYMDYNFDINDTIW